MMARRLTRAKYGGASVRSATRPPDHAAGFSIGVKPIPDGAGRAFRGRRCFKFVRRDTAVAVFVKPQDELAGLVDELFAGDLPVLIFVKIPEVCVRQCGV